MTEKRFTLKYIEEQHLSANLYDDKTFIGSIRIGAELIVELLNALSDENEQLTHDATVLIQANQDYRRENEQLKQFKEQHIEEYLKLKTVSNELKKENEQLKQVINENEKLIQSTYDELTKLRCIKKNLGRIKTQWDWIMEAIQYD